MASCEAGSVRVQFATNQVGSVVECPDGLVVYLAVQVCLLVSGVNALAAKVSLFVAFPLDLEKTRENLPFDFSRLFIL